MCVFSTLAIRFELLDHMCIPDGKELFKHGGSVFVDLCFMYLPLVLGFCLFKCISLCPF